MCTTALTTVSAVVDNGSACKDESPAGKAVQEKEKHTHTHTHTPPPPAKQNQKKLTPPERTSREEMGV